MLAHDSPRWAHLVQNLALITLSLALLPLNVFLLTASYLFGSTASHRVVQGRESSQDCNKFKPRRILVTGVGMSKGLTLARLFHKAGHTVIGADFDATACGSVSRALAKFHTLKAPQARDGAAPYVQSLLDIILHDHIDLWVSCSGVASAVEDGQAKEVVEQRTRCKAIQFNVKSTQMLHEKDSFIAHTQSLGLIVPETHTVTSAADADAVLRKAQDGRQFIVKPIGMDDSARGDMTLLPKATQEETRAHLARLRISKATPYILQQFIRGEEYCTHSLVVRGQVKAFVACPSAELLMHYEALPASTSLSKAMLEFTRLFAGAQDSDFSGHLSFDFLVENSWASRPEDIVLYPIECNPRAHTAVVLFNDTPAMVNGYLSMLDESSAVAFDERPVYPHAPHRYYWTGHDLITLLVSLFSTFSLERKLQSLSEAAKHAITWKDGTFQWWDPLPWFWLYHVYWTMKFLRAAFDGTRWSRVNVSTTKVFKC